jgi:putative NADPH-quinone reductase
MGKHVLIIDGHPDRREGRFIHALAGAYEQGATQAGHELRKIVVSELRFPLLTSNERFRDGNPPPDIAIAQQAIEWADHIVILYPLWLGSMPALLKGFFEQLLRPGFAFAEGGRRGMPRKLLKGKSARIVVTMGMPAAFYRIVYRAHSLKSLKRNILAFCGIKPVRTSVIGMMEGIDAVDRAAWLVKLALLGKRGM